MQRIIAENIRLPVTAPTEEIFSEAARRLKKAGISDIFDIKLHKRSLDARRRGNPCFVCSVICMCDVSTKTAEHLGRYSLKLCPKKTLDFPEGSEIMRARPVVIGDSMQIDSIVSQRIQLARERKRQNKEQAGAVADAGRTDPWTDQVDASRGEYVGDGVPRTFNGEPFEPLSGYPTPGAAPAPADPAAPDFLSTPSDFTTGNAR